LQGEADNKIVCNNSNKESQCKQLITAYSDDTRRWGFQFVSSTSMMLSGKWVNW